MLNNLNYLYMTHTTNILSLTSKERDYTQFFALFIITNKHKRILSKYNQLQKNCLISYPIITNDKIF